MGYSVLLSPFLRQGSFSHTRTATEPHYLGGRPHSLRSGGRDRRYKRYIRSGMQERVGRLLYPKLFIALPSVPVPSLESLSGFHHLLRRRSVQSCYLVNLYLMGMFPLYNTKIMIRTALFLIVFLLSLRPCPAQITTSFDVSFFQDGLELAYPLAGGLNLPELSVVDLNNDGIQDLYIFDKSGNRQLFFERLNDEIGLNFRYAPEYIDYFPPIKEWVLLRDYNGDGIQDMFAFSDQGAGGIIVFTGYYQENVLHFERFNFDETLNMIYFPVPGSTARSQIYVSKIDYPSIDDVDCDGDLDIITFAGGGKNIQWFRNTSVENGYGLDSLIFVLEDRCWGGLYEGGESNEVDLAAALGECFNDYRSDNLDFRHVGSTLLTFDADDDGDKELILGDVSFPEVTYLTNGGDCTQAWFNTQDSQFPSYDTPVNIPNFPTAFYLDLNNDGLNDLVACTNDILEYSEDYEVCWYYQNMGESGQPNFHLAGKDIFANEMIDVGTSAHPTVADVNTDGLPDIIIGNESKYTVGNERVSRLVLYLNTGTPTQPRFERTDSDFLGLSQFDGMTHGFAPTFGDLDNDGDLDIIIGDVLGTLFYGENTAGNSEMMQVNAFVANYMDINIGFRASPQLVDANRDGLLDLLVGESSGNINYFQNQGTLESPFFDGNEEASPNNWFFGRIDTRIPGYTTGNSSPFLLETADGLQIITGSLNGQIEYYGGVDANFSGAFPIINEDISIQNEGEKVHVFMADLNNDHLLELLVGNQSGGIHIYKTDFPDMEIVAVEPPHGAALPVQIYPNPVREKIYFKLPGGLKEIELFNALGAIVKSVSTRAESYELSVSDLPSGLYFIQVKNGTDRITQKLVH